MYETGRVRIFLKHKVVLLLSTVNVVVFPEDLRRVMADVDSILQSPVGLFNKALCAHIRCKEEKTVLVCTNTDHIRLHTSTLL